jgi:hypothetical protein
MAFYQIFHLGVLASWRKKYYLTQRRKGKAQERKGLAGRRFFL